MILFERLIEVVSSLSHYMYVPETVPDERVNYPFHEREDSAHILMVFELFIHIII